MEINVAQQLKGPLGNSRRYTVDHVNDDDSLIRGEVKLVLTSRSILVTGNFYTPIKEICSRCLEEFEYNLEFEIEEEFFPTGNILTVNSVDEDEEAAGFAISENHIIDLSEAWRQNILLNLPVKPICKPECAGLCQQCGHNLNQEPCRCPKDHIDPRWAPLKALLKEETVEKGSEVN